MVILNLSYPTLNCRRRERMVGLSRTAARCRHDLPSVSLVSGDTFFRSRFSTTDSFSSHTAAKSRAPRSAPGLTRSREIHQKIKIYIY